MVADQIARPAAIWQHRIFDDSYCDGISYDIRINKTEINLEAFFGYFGSQSENHVGFAHCAPKDKDTDHHVHLTWRVRKDDFVIEVEFVEGRIEPPKDAKEPFVEDLLPWLEKFFVTKSPNARIEADFTYPSEAWKSKFPLPLKVPVAQEAGDTEIDGISFALSDRPMGVAKIWMTQRPERLLVHVLAQRQIDLTTLNPRSDLTGLSTVVELTLEHKKQDDTEIRNVPKRENK